jgi:hypothetical protein
LIPLPALAQSLLWAGGQIDVRVEVDTGTTDSGDEFALWGEDFWAEFLWASSAPGWLDLSPFVLDLDFDGGAERWGQRFKTGSATVILDNTTGIFTQDAPVTKPFHLPFRPGRKIRVVAIPDPTADPESATYRVPLFTGIIDSTSDDYAEGAWDNTTRVYCFDNGAVFAGHNPPMLGTPTGVETSDERVTSALDRLNWPAGDRDVQTGIHSLQTSHLAQSTWEECQTAADAEGGAFFAGKDGKAVFKARDWLITDTRSITVQGWLGYDEIPTGEQGAHVIAVDTSWELARIRNQVRFARVGSTMQEAEDATSQTLYGVRSYERTDFENNADGALAILAARHVKVHKDNRMRVDAVTIAGVEDPDNEDLNRLLWAVEYGDLLTVQVKTGQGWSFERLVQVFGIHHHITGDDWLVTFRLDDAQINFLTGRDALMTQLGPIAWWKFSESGGTSTADQAGTHTLTWNGTPTLASSGGPIAGGDGMATLDGTDDYATVTDEGDLELHQNMTFEARVRPHDATGGLQAILSVRGAGTDRNLYSLYWHPDDSLYRFYPFTSEGSSTILDVGAANTWIHIVVTVEWTATERKITRYIDGGAGFTSVTSYLPSVVTREVNVGREGTDGGEFFDGDISELAVWDRLLTPSEITDLYNASYE